jgi:hypothetical protein
MENKAYIKYSVETRDIFFNPLNVKLKSSEIESLTLITVDNKTSLDFVVIMSVSLEEACNSLKMARSLTRGIAERVLDVLSWFYNKKFGKLSLENEYLESIDENENKIIIPVMTAGIEFGAEIILLTRVESLSADLIKAINLPYNDRKLILCKQFRFAVQSDDPVTRYMFLYNILLQIHNDRQTKVDDFIRKQEPTVKPDRSPIRPDVCETIYTRLRNEIAHLRSNATLEMTSKEIKSKVQDLQLLTKKAIEQA